MSYGTEVFVSDNISDILNSKYVNNIYIRKFDNSNDELLINSNTYIVDTLEEAIDVLTFLYKLV